MDSDTPLSLLLPSKSNLLGLKRVQTCEVYGSEHSNQKAGRCAILGEHNLLLSWKIVTPGLPSIINFSHRVAVGFPKSIRVHCLTAPSFPCRDIEGAGTQERNYCPGPPNRSSASCPSFNSSRRSSSDRAAGLQLSAVAVGQARVQGPHSQGTGHRWSISWSRHCRSLWKVSCPAIKRWQIIFEAVFETACGGKLSPLVVSLERSGAGLCTALRPQARPLPDNLVAEYTAGHTAELTRKSLTH